MTREWQKTGREVILMLEEKDKETDIQESTKRKKKGNTEILFWASRWSQMNILSSIILKWPMKSRC